MGTEHTPTKGRFILLQDERFVYANKSDTDSSYTQASPIPGEATAQVDSYMVIETSGDHVADGYVDIQTARAGHPRLDDGGYVYRTSSTGNWHGWDGYQLFTDWEVIKATDTAIDPEGPMNVVRTESGLLMATGRAVVAGNQVVEVYDPDTSSWTLKNAPKPKENNNGEYRNCLCPLPSGRVLLLAVGAGTQHRYSEQCDVWYTDDDGDTWAEYARSTLDATIGGLTDSKSLYRIRAAYSAGEMLLCVEYDNSGTNDVRQYASDDLGQTFTTVNSSVDSVYYINIVPIPGGGFRAVYWDDANRVAAASLASAYDDLDEADISYVYDPGGTLYCHVVTAWIDEDEVIYVLWAQGGTDPATIYMIRRSDDYGDSWDSYEGNPWMLVTNNEGLYDFDADSVQGRAKMLTRWKALGAEAQEGNDYAEHSVAAISLGGYSSQTAPAYDTKSYQDTDYMCWNLPGDNDQYLYMPIETPDNLDWTDNGAGSWNVNNAVLTITTAANTKYAVQTFGTDTDALFFEAKVDSDRPDVTSDKSAIRITIGNGGGAGNPGYDVSIRLSASSYRVYDNNAGATVATVAKGFGTTRKIRVLLDKEANGGGNIGNLFVWTTQDAHSRDWTLDVESHKIQDGSNGPSPSVKWGHLAAWTGSTTWYYAAWEPFALGYWTGRYEQDYIGEDWTRPDDLHPRSFPSVPCLIDQGMKIRSASGPSRIKEWWSIEADYQHALRFMFPEISPSPGKPWRSTSDASAVNIGIDTEESFTATRADNSAIGLYLGNINFRSAILQGYNTGTTSWDTIGTLDAALDTTAAAYVRTGSRVIPDTSTAAVMGQYLYHEAHAGDHIDLGSSKIRRIQHNTEGAWRGSGSTTKRPTIVLHPDDIDGTEPASGDCRIWRRDALLVVPEYTDTYERLRVRITAQTTAEGYFEIGAMMIGPLLAMAHPYDWGWTDRLSHQVDVTTRPDGRRMAYRRGDMRREITIGWVEGAQDYSGIEEDDPDVDYDALSTGGEPVSTHHDTMRAVSGAIQRIGGPYPCVLCMAGEVSASAYTVTHPHALLYGRVMADQVQVTQVQGDEMETDVHRLEQLTIEEEL